MNNILVRSIVGIIAIVSHVNVHAVDDMEPTRRSLDEIAAESQQKSAEQSLSQKKKELAVTEKERIQSELDLLEIQIKWEAAQEAVRNGAYKGVIPADGSADESAVSRREPSPLDSVCVTKITGPTDDLAADVWYRGEVLLGLKAGETISESLTLKSIHTSMNRGWGIALSLIHI